MNKRVKIVLSIIAISTGWLSIGIGYGTTARHGTGSFLFTLGILLFFGGIIGTIRAARSR